MLVCFMGNVGVYFMIGVESGYYEIVDGYVKF